MAVAGIPAGAYAAQPTHPTTPANTNTNSTSAAAKVQFVLHGSLSAYTPANGASNGTITLLVKGSNRDSTTLKNMTLVFTVTPATKVVLHDGAAIAPSGDNGIVKLRLAKNNSTWTGLTAGQVIDQGAPAAS
jgi:hypothetical protein